MTRRCGLYAALALMAALLFAPGPAAAAEPVKVFAAASLKTALDKIGVAWTAKDASQSIVAVYAASSALARQIEQGAPADIFISADLDWANELERKGLLRAGSRQVLAGNELVLIAPAGSGLHLDLKPGVDLAGALSGGKLAVADVAAVPAGKYAKAALQSLGLWAAAEPALAQAENVRAALALVAHGEARLGIVYASDARSEAKVEVAGTFLAASHPPIVYPMAIVGASANAGAEALAVFLISPEAKAILAAEGFTAAP